ncbi:tripartite tricarboxylate transporter substrate binding protein [Saccharopolyspora mangrovi]|uniref:Tripartite tricarboxylate transporter substrate binding protein n=1 Tax=Saccharopolyspora mangrovi TaxID=3082379 RepID=A0ABU6AET2_9PSEU|nr:tripartite tricarboxylate transporter substrate binding protein [Saccharopolyspora sp. S2-29]MEB3370059.1 tripartite tricarboxylate transporter substrate binding protein [Saccharopolyspora sp. S2-29]
MPRTRMVLTGLAASLAVALSACAGTPNSDGAYPDDDITFIVQAAAGGGSDLTSRALAAELEPILGTSIVVENRPGASGSTAMQYVADQRPDGYTIGFSPVEVSMLGHQDFDVDPADYDFLGQVMHAPGVLSVPSDSPYRTLQEFLDAAKNRELSVSNAGAGSIWEATTLGLAQRAGAKLAPVPFDGGSPAVAAAVGRQVDAAVAGAGETMSAYREGQLRPLAIFHHERHPQMPDVPTAAEAGHDLEFGGWGGIYAPAGLPDDVRETLESAIKRAAQTDTFIKAISTPGNLPVYRSAAEFTSFVNSEHARFGKLLGGS